jgi:hypothetical protein
MRTLSVCPRAKFTFSLLDGGFTSILNFPVEKGGQQTARGLKHFHFSNVLLEVISYRDFNSTVEKDLERC